MEENISELDLIREQQMADLERMKEYQLAQDARSAAELEEKTQLIRSILDNPEQEQTEEPQG